MTPELRLDRVVKERFPQMTSRQVQEAIEGGLVSVKGLKSQSKSTKVFEASQVTTAALAGHLETLKAGNPELSLAVLSEKPDWYAVDKPAGLPGHPLGLWERDTVTHWLFARDAKARAEFSAVQPTVTPHRLDTGTSGVLIVSRTAANYASWRADFSEKRVEKTYLAWCWGHPKEDTFVVERPLEHHWDKRRMQVAKEGAEGKSFSAYSDVTVLRREKGYFLCEVVCRTGVMHQVRVHLAHRGYPLVGDALYDPKNEDRPFKSRHHQLRAIYLRAPFGEIRASRETFEEGPNLN